MKAECYLPGTYHVVVNPDSFSNAADYTDDTDDDLHSSPNSKSGHRSTKSTSQPRNRIKSRPQSSMGTDDPNVVILTKFEDSFTINSGYWKPSRVTPPTSTARSKSPDEFDDNSLLNLPRQQQPLLLHHITHVEDARLLSHFRSVVWRHLVQTSPGSDYLPADGINIPGADIFEREAAGCRPVSHTYPSLENARFTNLCWVFCAVISCYDGRLRT